MSYRCCANTDSLSQYNQPARMSRSRGCRGLPNIGGSVEIKKEVLSEVLSLLDEVLSLKGRAQSFTLDTPLLGALPELDSMAVVALITGLEERFGFMVDDDEIDGSAFASVESLATFVQDKLGS